MRGLSYMKKMCIFSILLLVAISLLVTGCGQKGNTPSGNEAASQVNNESTNTAEQPKEREGYYFEYNGVEIGINDPAAPILKALGEPKSYFEAKSCAFDGMDKIYSYNGFEFQTYTENGEDYVFSIVFLDDSVTTREGIGLNATLEQVTSKYGTNYEKSFELYTYKTGKSKLSFLFENNAVASIEYSLIVEENKEN